MPSLSKSLSRLRPENCHRHPVCALSCPMAEKGGSPSVSRGGLRAKLNNICSWDHRIIVVIRPIIVVIYGYIWLWWDIYIWSYWFVVYPPSWKIWWTSSVGIMMKFPIFLESHNFLWFQTTNQNIDICLYILHLLAVDWMCSPKHTKGTSVYSGHVPIQWKMKYSKTN